MKFNKLILSVVVLSLGLTSCGKSEETDGPASDASNVSVYTAQKTDISSTVTYTGEIKASATVSVSGKVSGTVKSVNAELGDYVEAGQTLLQIDKTDYQLAYNQALAAYNSAQASLESARATYNSTVGGNTQKAMTALEQALSAAEAEYSNSLSAYEREQTMFDNNTNLVAAKNAMQTAGDNYTRMQTLFSMGAISQVELDGARMAYENAQAAVQATESNLQAALDAARTRFENAELNLKSARQNYELQRDVLNGDNEISAKAMVENAEAAIASTKVALDMATNNLNNTTIVAPVAGYVASKNISSGEMAGAGVPLFTIMNADTVEAEINVTESIIPYITVGTPASVKISSAGIDGILGTVTLTNPTKSAATGLYTVRVSIPNSDNKINVGMFADITLTTQSVEDAVIVPVKSVIQSGDNYHLYIANGDTAQKQEVVLGISDGEYFEVASGVSQGDKVVVSGKEYLSEKNNAINITSEVN